MEAIRYAYALTLSYINLSLKTFINEYVCEALAPKVLKYISFLFMFLQHRRIKFMPPLQIRGKFLIIL